MRCGAGSFHPVRIEIGATLRMNIVLLVIGDEILSGKRQDRHVAQVIAMLAERGMALTEARMLGDGQAAIAAAVREIHARGDVILSCGGIGATPDDRTRQAIAEAFSVPIERHREGEALILAEYGERALPNRVLMADFPQGAALIPNPVNRVAGFSMDRVYCVPGFPEMAWPMLAWVLDGPLSHLHQANPPVEYRLRVTGTRGEGDLLEQMEAVLARYPGVGLSSLPHRGGGDLPRHIEFGIKGPAESAAEAFRWFTQAVTGVPGAVVELLSVPPDQPTPAAD